MQTASIGNAAWKGSNSVAGVSTRLTRNYKSASKNLPSISGTDYNNEINYKKQESLKANLLVELRLLYFSIQGLLQAAEDRSVSLRQEDLQLYELLDILVKQSQLMKKVKIDLDLAAFIDSCAEVLQLLLNKLESNSYAWEDDEIDSFYNAKIEVE
jgi:hypothetical protein